MNRTETIQNLTDGLDPLLIQWLALEDWETLPTEDQLADIAAAWYIYGDDTAGFSRHVRNLMGENTVTADEIYRDLLRDREAYRKIVSFEFSEYDEGEYGFVKALEDKYDVHGAVIYDAMSEIRLQFRRNF